MPIVYRDMIRGEPRPGPSFPAPTSDVLTETFAQTFEENPIKAYQRWNELKTDERTGPTLDAATARRQLKDAGLESHLKVNDSGITQAALDTLMERKRIELRRQEIFSRAQGGLGEGAARLGLSIATTLADPISMGLNFVPIVGQVRYARMLAQAGGMAGRIGVRAGVGAAEGAVGAAIAEPFIYTMRTQEQADYDAADSLLNIALGGITGAGLHSTVGTIGELISKRLPERTVPSRMEPTIGETRVDDVAPLRAGPEELPADIQRVIFGGPDVDAPRSAEPLPADIQRVIFQEPETRVVEPLPEDIQRTIFQVPEPGAREELPADIQRAIFQGPEPRELGAAEKQVAALTPREREVMLRAAVAQAVEGRPIDVEGIAAAARASRPEPYINGIPEARPDARTPTLTPLLPETAGARPTTPGPAGRTEPEISSDFADEVLAREKAPSAQVSETEARAAAADDELALAEADLRTLEKRLNTNLSEGAEMEALKEAAAKAERWARVAELATVCLVRGG